jgi:hypothetical protein
VDYEVPEVTDDMVNRAMEELRQNQALLEPADRPAKLTDQVTLSHIFVTALPGSAEEEAESAEDEAGEEAAAASSAQGEVDTETNEDTAGEADLEGDDEAGDDTILTAFLPMTNMTCSPVSQPNWSA